MREDKGWLLALDLSTPRGVLVLDGPAGTFQREIEGGSRVSHLFVAADEVMSDAGIAPHELALLGVGRGPGSFTGVRVAVTAAKFMAVVLGVPLVAPDSLMVTAAAAAGTKETVFAAIDARRGEVYHALYRLDNGYPVALHQPSVSSPEIALERIAGWGEEKDEAVVMVGTGIDAYPDMWPKGLSRLEDDLPEPRGLARLCRLAAGRGEYSDPVSLLPLYIRRPDARERYGCGEGGVE